MSVKIIVTLSFILCFSLFDTVAQREVRDYIEEWVAVTYDTNVEKPLYYLNDVVCFYPDLIETIEIDKIGAVWFFPYFTSDILFSGYGSLIFVEAYTQKKKWIKKTIEAINNLEYTPAFILNGVPMNPIDGMQFINSVKKKSIYFIQHIDEPVKQQIYGDSGQYGLVSIKMR